MMKIISAEIQRETILGSKLNILIETYSYLKCKSKMQFYPINFFCIEAKSFKYLSIYRSYYDSFVVFNSYPTWSLASLGLLRPKSRYHHRYYMA